MKSKKVFLCIVFTLITLSTFSASQVHGAIINDEVSNKALSDYIGKNLFNLQDFFADKELNGKKIGLFLEGFIADSRGNVYLMERGFVYDGKLYPPALFKVGHINNPNKELTEKELENIWRQETNFIKLKDKMGQYKVLSDKERKYYENIPDPEPVEITDEQFNEFVRKNISVAAATDEMIKAFFPGREKEILQELQSKLKISFSIMPYDQPQIPGESFPGGAITECVYSEGDLMSLECVVNLQRWAVTDLCHVDNINLILQHEMFHVILHVAYKDLILRYQAPASLPLEEGRASFFNVIPNKEQLAQYERTMRAWIEAGLTSDALYLLNQKTKVDLDAYPEAMFFVKFLVAFEKTPEEQGRLFLKLYEASFLKNSVRDWNQVIAKLYGKYGIRTVDELDKSWKKWLEISFTSKTTPRR